MRLQVTAGGAPPVTLVPASLLTAILLAVAPAIAQGEIIETIAGGGPDGLPATSVGFGPTAIAIDPAGGFYLAVWDWNYHARIYKVDTSGVLHLIAGTGVDYPPGNPGEGKPATRASLAVVYDLLLDPAGNLFTADTSRQRIQRIDGTTSIFTTLGGSVGGFPFGIARGAAGDLYVSSYSSHWVRRIDAVTGIQTTVAGTGVAGFSGDGGPAAAAQLSYPCAIEFDGDGDLYIVDTGNRRIRKVDALTGTISTVAGTGNEGFEGDGGPATSANFYMPFSGGLAIDGAGNLFFADWGQDGDGPFGTRIRRIDAATGVISLYAGAGSGYGEGIPALGAHMDEPVNLAFDTAGDLLVADQGNTTVGGGGRVWKIVTSTGLMYTLAGANGTDNGNGGPATSATFDGTFSVTSDPAGNIFLVEGYTQVRRVDAATGIITLVAGGGHGYNGDGIPATSAYLSWPRGTALDAAGHLFIADHFNHRVRRVDAVTGIITTYAGNGTAGSAGDGMKATLANLNRPYDVAMAGDGTLYIADLGNNRIRIVNPVNGKIEAFAGTGAAGFGGDGGPATAALLRSPHAVVRDGAGNVFIADTENFRIRRVDAVTGVITTVAGNGTLGYGGDGGPAVDGMLGRIESMDVDSDGNLLLGDYTNNRVRKVDMVSGLIETVVGTGARGYSGDGEVPTRATVGGLRGLAVEASGGFILGADRRIRRVSPTSAPTEAGRIGDGNPPSEAGLSIATTAPGMITLSWGASCYTSDTDFDVYEGTMGSFATHVPRVCGTGNVTSLTFTPAAGSAYYLVAPRSYAREGSYGVDGDGLERPASLSACIPQEIAACP